MILQEMSVELWALCFAGIYMSSCEKGEHNISCIGGEGGPVIYKETEMQM